MSAYNWIVVEACCPICHENVCVKCQTHVASSFDGDSSGRFHNRQYRVGESMRWWPQGRTNYEAWRADGRIDGPTSGPIDWECCYASCPACDGDLYAVIRFEGPRPVAVERVGVEVDWPKEFWK